jgi:undecaprenyl-phosphate 4-deoxy-4-formamido-L-arabinose transferase
VTVSETSESGAPPTLVAIVVPVYQGEHTLRALVSEIEPLTQNQRTPDGHVFRVSELILVHDGAPDRSGRVMLEVAEQQPFVRAIWLSKNFGQHPATLAGMASSTAEWVATLDEDGQQDPKDIAKLLDIALRSQAQLVYAQPLNKAPHGWLRNTLSAAVKWFFVFVLGNSQLGTFNSFRLIHGEIARGLAAYCGVEVYLDVALSWVARRAERCPVLLREERGRPSGYTLRKLFAHFWRLVLTSGTRPLRFISWTGLISIGTGVTIAVWALVEKFRSNVPVQGWTSLMIVVCFFSGFLLFSMAIIAEYLGVTVSMAMGRPLYMIVSRPTPSGIKKP